MTNIIVTPFISGSSTGSSTWTGDLTYDDTSTSTFVINPSNLNNIITYNTFETLISQQFKVADGEECKIDLPDGTVIDVKQDGSFQIIDKDAKVIYRAARMRDFNRYINVSDRIEEFIAFCGAHAVRKDEMLQLPLKLFIGWLILEAAKADQVDDLPDVRLIPDLRQAVLPRCVSCGRFIQKAFKQKKLEFCRPLCFEKHWATVVA